MSARQAFELVALGALWGASFLFMRQAVPEFGPVPLIALRVALASLFLMPILLFTRGLKDLRCRWKAIFIVGVINSALPFCLFAFSTLSLSAGFASILNATAPLFGAIVVFVWLGERLTWNRILGLCIGFLGIVTLVLSKGAFSLDGSGLAVVAALGGTFFYGLGANYTKKYLGDVYPLAVAAGSQFAAALALLVPAIYTWPQHTPTVGAWMHVLALAIACTGLAYILFFRLISHIGPAKAITVTFMIPLFGMFWGAIFLHEQVTAYMMGSCAVIFFGTGLATGLIRFPERKLSKV